MGRKILKELITKNSLIDEARLRELEALAASSGTSLTSTIINGNYAKEEVLLPLVGEYYGVEWLDLDTLEDADASLYSELSDEMKYSEKILPIYKKGDEVVIAVSSLIEVEVLDQLRNETGWNLKPVISIQEKIEKMREKFENAGKSVEDALTELGDDSSSDKSLEELANEAPTIKRVNLIIMQAISEGVSDIHIEPYENKAVVRYRSDGVLKETESYPKDIYPAIISRIKIMADLNIAERRIPQDGRITLKLMERKYDLRVAVIPTLHGEGVVMRILDNSSIVLSLSDLGFSPGLLENFEIQLKKPHGIVLVTGPTGSGKTTTLYAALSSIKSPTSKIITIEDPVEYNLEGVTQIHVNSKVGLTFAAGLRSILRLDPDIVMVGEIRDAETAEIAIRAALTGHLVFSTLHTNDAPSAVTRLLDMGVADYLISSSLNAILAQRLVRKLCDFCKVEADRSGSVGMLLTESGVSSMDPVYRAKGCYECNSVGYSGRVGIHELLEMTEAMRGLLNDKPSLEVIKAQLKSEGMKSMRDDGVAKMLLGKTTADEVLRVTQVD